MGGPPLRPGFEDLAPYRSVRPGAKVLLDANESPRTASRIQRRLLKRISTLELNRYPSRARAGEVADSIGSMHGLSGDEVLLGNGSNEVILAVHLAYGGPGRKAVYFEPTYSVYRLAAQMSGTEPVAVGRNDDFSISEAALEEAARLEPSIIHLCSPNNPTGNRDPAGFAAEVASAFPDAVVVVDHAYAPFGRDPEETELLERQNVVVVRTFSKAAGLAGLRIGYGLARGGPAEALKKAFLPYNLDAVSLEAAAICVEEAQAIREDEEALGAERERIRSALSGHDWLVAYPSDANFVLFGPRGAGRARAEAGVGAAEGTDSATLTRKAKRLWEALLEKSVLVRDCTNWPGLRGCLRVSAGLAEETDHFVGALEEAVARIDP